MFYDGLMGMAVADALGVPHEGRTREELKREPVSGMMGNMAHNQPAGSWSDDTSMTLCCADSLCRGFDLSDMMKRFVLWKDRRQYTAAGNVFDVGRTCRRAIDSFSAGADPEYCGDRSEMGNGNGGLMRVFPAALWSVMTAAERGADTDGMLETVHAVSALTHAHERGLVCCGMYTLFLDEWLRKAEDECADEVAQRAFERAGDVYRAKGGAFAREMDAEGQFVPPAVLKGMREPDLRSGGYVVDTLHSALWCLLTTDNYADCVLKAVNLGDDTDTTAAVAGSLAGFMYGAETIPAEWMDALLNKELITDVAERLNNRVNGKEETEVYSFTGEHAHMSLKYSADVEMDGVVYANAYAAYLALKTPTEFRDQFAGLTAHRARRLFKQLPSADDSDEKDEEALYKACMAKYEQNSELRAALLNTDGMDIVYDTTGAHDNHMGRCGCGSCKGQAYENLLGKTLMRVRDELMK